MTHTEDNILASFLKLLGVKHTNHFSDKYFNEHPHKYNLFGISKMLSDYGIENAGVKIQDKEKDILDIELPFIAHFGNDFVAVTQVGLKNVACIRNGKKLIMTFSDFVEAWTGIVLLAEATSDSREPDFQAHRRTELWNVAQKLLLLVAGSVLLGIIYVSRSLFSNLGITLLLLTNLTGVYIGYLLTLKQLHIHSQYADKICSLFSQSDCNNVLESEAAKLWGIFGWSEIGLGYFLGNVLILLFLPQAVTLLAVINIFTLPYSFWSIWYQKVKAKQWCPLCLCVQGLLWILFILNGLFGYIQLPSFSLSVFVNLLLIACTYSILMLIFNLTVPLLSGGEENQQIKQEINAIKANEVSFKALLNQEPFYETSKSDSQILLGHPDARLKITILTNPFCNPCAKMHKRVEQFLKDTNNAVCVQYIFSSFSKELDFANQYLIAAYLQKGPKEGYAIFNEWFEKGNLLKEAFFSDLNLDIDHPDVKAEFQKHEAWKERTQLRATPTILVNGYQLPKNYKIKDLKYFLQLEIDVKQSLPR